MCTPRPLRTINLTRVNRSGREQGEPFPHEQRHHCTCTCSSTGSGNTFRVCGGCGALGSGRRPVACTAFCIMQCIGRGTTFGLACFGTGSNSPTGRARSVLHTRTRHKAPGVAGSVPGRGRGW